MPPPPGRFSRTKGWPSTCPTWSSTMRATRSLALPAANGLIASIGRLGQSAATAAAAVPAMIAAAVIALTTTAHKARNDVMLSSATTFRGHSCPRRAPWQRDAFSQGDARNSNKRSINRHAGGAERRTVFLDLGHDDALQICGRAMLGRHHEGAGGDQRLLHRRRIHG